MRIAVRKQCLDVWRIMDIIDICHLGSRAGHRSSSRSRNATKLAQKSRITWAVFIKHRLMENYNTEKQRGRLAKCTRRKDTWGACKPTLVWSGGLKHTSNDARETRAEQRAEKIFGTTGLADACKIKLGCGNKISRDCRGWGSVSYIWEAWQADRATKWPDQETS